MEKSIEKLKKFVLIFHQNKKKRRRFLHPFKLIHQKIAFSFFFFLGQKIREF